MPHQSVLKPNIFEPLLKIVLQTFICAATPIRLSHLLATSDLKGIVTLAP